MEKLLILFLLLGFGNLVLGSCDQDLQTLGPIRLLETDSPGKVLINFTNSQYPVDLICLLPRGDPKCDYVSVNRTGDDYKLILSKQIDVESFTKESLTNHEIGPLRYYVLQCGANFTVSLIVMAVDEFRPRFVAESFNISIPEDSFKGIPKAVFHFNTSDDDNGARFQEFTMKQIQPETSGSIFDLPDEDDDSRSIMLTAPLDYETGPRLYILQVTAGEEKGTMSSSVNVTIHITDADDQNPEFDKQVYNFAVPEGNYSPGSSQTFIPISVLARDKDTLNETIHYNITQGYPSQCGSVFQIDTLTGQIRVVGVLDVDKLPQCILIVEAFQTNQPTFRKAMATVVLEVVDVNNHRPVMSETFYNGSVQENLARGTLVYRVQAYDEDRVGILELGNNSKFAYHLYAQPVPGVFDIEAETGWIRVNNSHELDRETHTVFSLKVYAKELYTEEHWSSNHSIVNITLLDVNDNSPHFTPQTYNFTVNKTATIGQAVGQVNATDRDVGKNGDIKYKIIGRDEISHKFRIDHHTGQITVNGSLERDFRYQYNFQVMAEDQTTDVSKRRYNICDMTVNVLDVNNHPPEFVSLPKSISVSGNTAPGVVVTQLMATDEDVGDDLTFGIDQGSGGGIFMMDPQSGKVNVTRILSEKQNQHIALNVSVSDGLHTTYAAVNVFISDTNDFGPQFNQTLYNFTINENLVNFTVGTVQATDDDFGNNSLIGYSLDLLGLGSDDFSIDATSGAITCQSKLDREKIGSGPVRLIAIATDHGIPQLSGTTTVQIYVEDVNDNAPVFPEPTVNISLPEGAVSSVIYTAMANDPDAGRNKEILYALKSSSSMNTFSVSKFGNVTALKELQITGATNGVYKLVIEAYNSVPYDPTTLQNGTLTMSIYCRLESPFLLSSIKACMDRNDQFPHFLEKTYQYSIEESSIPGSLVGKLTAIDNDTSKGYSTVHYYIRAGNDGDLFRIDSILGDLYLNRKLNYDPPGNDRTFNLTVYASDLDIDIESVNLTSPHIVTQTVQINVTDVNDNQPQFNQTPLNAIGQAIEQRVSSPPERHRAGY
ncbi:hypothetical protein ScPMuIL_004208 [Solemya velum]